MVERTMMIHGIGCPGKNRGGEPCINFVVNGQKTCRHHTPEAIEARRQKRAARIAARQERVA